MASPNPLSPPSARGEFREERSCGRYSGNGGESFFCLPFQWIQWSCSHLKRDRCLPTTGQHSVRSQAKVTASAGQRRGDIKMVDCGRGLTKTNLVLKLSFVHERHGASRARKTISG
jgi:hypothetical protein